MPSKSFQVVMRVDVDIEEFDPVAVGAIGSDGAPIPNAGLRYLESVALEDRVRYQRELFDALVADPPTLHKWYVLEILALLEAGDVYRPPFVPDDEGLIAPLLERLSPEARRFYERAIELDALYEAAFVLYEAVICETASVTIMELPE